MNFHNSAKSRDRETQTATRQTSPASAPSGSAHLRGSALASSPEAQGLCSGEFSSEDEYLHSCPSHKPFLKLVGILAVRATTLSKMENPRLSRFAHAGVRQREVLSAESHPDCRIERHRKWNKADAPTRMYTFHNHMMKHTSVGAFPPLSLPVQRWGFSRSM